MSDKRRQYTREQVLERMEEFAKVVTEPNTIYNVPRQTGKTTKAMDYFTENMAECLYIVPNQNIKEFTQKLLIEYQRNIYNMTYSPINNYAKRWLANCKSRMITFSEFREGKARGVEYRTVVIDEVFMQNSEELAIMFYHLGRTGTNYVAFGTDLTMN